MTNQSTNSPGDASGVQNLIEKLKDDGVSQGRAEAERIVAQARREAADIIDGAHTEAQQLLARAREDAEQIETNGKQALQLAARDASLQLKEQLQSELERRLGVLVGQSLQDPELIRQMILEITSSSISTVEPTSEGDLGNLQLLVSAGSDPQANAKLDELVQGIGGDMLADGVQLQLVGEPESGVRIKLTERDMELELTESALTKWLMRFLAPRFQAIIEAA